MAHTPQRRRGNSVRAQRATQVADTDAPQRAVITRSPHRVVGAVPIPWLQAQAVHHESHLEHCFIYAVCLFGGARALTHQGSAIDLPAGHRYHSDFLVRFLDGSELLVEIKPRAFLGRVEARLNAVASCYHTQHRTFAVVTDAELLLPCFECLAPLAFHYARYEFPKPQLDQLLQRVHALGRRCLIADLIDPHEPATRPPILHLIGRGRLRVSPTSWCGDHSPVAITSFVDDGEIDVAHLFLRWLGARPWRAHARVSSDDRPHERTV
jgi:hypothetical protein